LPRWGFAGAVCHGVTGNSHFARIRKLQIPGRFPQSV
jgi:hypothetical protein